MTQNKEEMIEQLSTASGRSIIKHIKEETDYSDYYYEKEFGSIEDACKEAGVHNIYKREGYDSIYMSITDGEKFFFEDLDLDDYRENANFYVYRLTFSEEQFYIGATSDMKRRLGEREYWPVDEDPIDLYVESFDNEEEAMNRERELRYETAIEFDTNNVKGGLVEYNSDCSPK